MGRGGYRFWEDAEWAHLEGCYSNSSEIPQANNKHREKYPNRSDMSIWSIIKRHGKQAQSMLGKPPDPTTIRQQSREASLQATVLKLNEELSAVRKEVGSFDRILDLAFGLSKCDVQKRPKWTRPDFSGNPSVTGTPLLVISDIHHTEVVEPSQVENLNKFNSEISIARVKHTFDTAVMLCKSYLSHPKYESSVIAFAGDIISGNIHPELAETNDQRILKGVVEITDALEYGVRLFANSFGSVHCPCVVGNHSRMHDKPRYKNRVFDNFEWLIYTELARRTKDNKHITFDVSESADCVYNIYGKSYLLTHGDQFHGGTGIAGLFSPLMLGLARKQARQQAFSRWLYLTIMGHWHQYIHTNRFIVNSSIKGYDEFAYIHNMPFEPAQQALFLSHPTKGINWRMPVLCDRVENFWMKKGA